MIPSLHPLTNRLRRRMAAAVAVAVTALLPLAMPTAPTAQASDAVRKADAAGGYWMVASDGGIFSFGAAPFYGSTGNVALNKPIVGMAATSTGKGYWFVAADGGIFSFGDAKFYGSTGNVALNKPIVGMAPTPSGKGYWFVASDGGIFSFGDAKFYGSTGDVRLNKPIVGMAASPSGNGYWFVASDGGIFSFGDAKFYGSTGNVHLAKPITAMAASPTGNGYWFTAADGGVFSFGDAKFFGAEPSGSRTVSAMVPAADGAGYWMASTNGELLSFGSAANLGGLTQKPNKPIVGMTAVPAVASGPNGTNPTVPSTGGNNSTTTTTAGPIVFPPGGPLQFSSTALHSWGTPADIDPPDTSPSKCSWNSKVPPSWVCPYSKKVSAIVEIGDRVYIGGEFGDLHQNNHPKTPTMSGIPMERLAELDTNGNAVSGSPFNSRVQIENGAVRALALYNSPAGPRLIVGGEFKRVNGENRPYLVSLDPKTGEIDHGFNPPTPDKYVGALAVLGDRLYVAGAYTMLGATPRQQLAAFNASTGAFDAGFNPPPRARGKFVGHTGKPVTDLPIDDPEPYGSINTLLITPDSKYLMVGGSFLYFGYDSVSDANRLHSGLISIDPTTGGLCGQAGVACTWQPAQGSKSSRPMFGMANYPGDPRAVGIDASQMIFTASGGAGGRVIAWLPGGKPTQQWRGNMDGDAMGVLATKERVYVVGHFDHTVADPGDDCLDIDPNTGGVHCDAGTANRHLAAFDVRGDQSNGKKGWSLIDPSFTAQADTNEGPYTIAMGATRMYVGGNFTDLANFPLSRGCSDPVTANCTVDRQPGFAVYPGK